jgi:PKD repeat protein
LGGSSWESTTFSTRNSSQIGINAKGEVWVIGNSTSADFPITKDAFQKTNDTLGYVKTDNTLTKLNPDLNQLLYSSYFGGKYGEIMLTNSIIRKGCVTHILLGGETYSNDFPTTKDGLMPNPPKDTLYGSLNYIDRYQKGFISRFSDTLSIEKTNFATSKLRCNQFLEILDGANKGARHRWSTNDSGQYLFVTQPGTYWLEATYGCDTLRDTITIIQQFGPKTVLPLDTFICDKKAIVLDALNDTIAATYLWSTTETAQKITVTKSGTYWVKITTANCGDITDTIHVHYITAPVLRLPKDTSICNQDSTILTIGQNNFEKTTWQDTIQTSRFIVHNAGGYKVKTSNICGVDSASIQVNFAKSPKPFKKFKDTTICEGAEFVVKTGTPNNQETYLWENTTTQKTVSVADTFFVNQSGKFVVYKSNICGSSADSFSVTYLQLPLINLDSVYKPCQGSSLPLTAGKPNNQEKYLWSNNAITATTTYNQSGNHWVQVSNNCGTAFQYFKIAFATKPKALFNNPDVCEGQAFVLNNQSTQATGISYIWRLGDGTIDSGFAPVHTYKKTGNARTFLVSLHVASSKDCADSITLPINVNITPDASFDAAAQNKTVFFTPKNTDNQNTYKWNFGDGDSSTAQQPNHTYKADSGTYTVCLTLSNAANCSSTQCQQVHFSVGINDLKAQGIAIYPNPTNGELTIEFSSQSANCSIFLYNTLGQQVFEHHHLSSKQSLDISHLNKGVYWVNLVVDGVVWSSKVVVY